MKVSENSNPAPGEPFIISYLAIRKFVGVLGVALPFVSVAGTFIFGNCKTILPSLSQYYYSVMGNYFVGSLCGVAMFLFTYKGYEKWDRILTNIAGICAVVSAFFPTHISSAYLSCFVNTSNSSNFSNLIHLISSALFLLSLAIMSIFLFTKSKGTMTPQKKVRNKIYTVCGVVMLVAIISIGLFKIPSIYIYFEKYKPTFYLETIGVLSFGISWLIKGEFILKDE